MGETGLLLALMVVAVLWMPRSAWPLWIGSSVALVQRAWRWRVDHPTEPGVTMGPQGSAGRQ